MQLAPPCGVKQSEKGSGAYVCATPTIPVHVSIRWRLLGTFAGSELGLLVKSAVLCVP